MMWGTKIERDIWPFPKKETILGRYVKLEPLSQDHLSALWQVVQSAPESFEFLRYGPFSSINELSVLIDDLSTRADQPFWAAVGEDGTAQGWLSICDVYQSDGAFEIGSIWFSPSMQGTRAAREAIYLLMSLGMNALEYERLVWRCQAHNEKSFKAALNLGFTHEGTWRNAAVVGGWQRDIAWFSILREEWPSRKQAFKNWLREENFDHKRRQKVRLQELR